MSTSSAQAFLSSTGSQRVLTWATMPMTKLPTMAP